MNKVSSSITRVTPKMAELFSTSNQNISWHIANLLIEKELDENTVRQDFRHTVKIVKNDMTKKYIPDCDHEIKKLENKVKGNY